MSIDHEKYNIIPTESLRLGLEKLNAESERLWRLFEDAMRRDLLTEECEEIRQQAIKIDELKVFIRTLYRRRQRGEYSRTRRKDLESQYREEILAFYENECYLCGRTNRLFLWWRNRKYTLTQYLVQRYHRLGPPEDAHLLCEFCCLGVQHGHFSLVLPEQRHLDQPSVYLDG